MIILILILILLVFLIFLLSSQNNPKKELMTRRWIDHIYLTRLYINSYLFDIPTQDADKERLLKNQKDIGDLLNNQQVTDLLTQHIVIAAEILALAKDNQPYQDKKQEWIDNAIALSSIIPHKGDFKAMMLSHLNLTEREIGALLSGDYEKSISLLDDLVNEAIEMSKMIKV